MKPMLVIFKAWFSKYLIPVAVVVGSALAFSLVGVSYLYSQKVDSYNELVRTNDATVKELGGLRIQIEEERIRHKELEEKQKLAYADFLQRQQVLSSNKNDKVKKEQAAKNKEQYEAEVQKNLEDFTKRMNCLSGNKASCSRI